MTWSLFIDDERDPPEHNAHWTIARSCEQAKSLILDRGMPDYISFDHDLGPDQTGYDFARWLGDHVLDNQIDLSEFSYHVHSQNPVGRDNIDIYLRNLMAVVAANGWSRSMSGA